MRTLMNVTKAHMLTKNLAGMLRHVNYITVHLNGTFFFGRKLEKKLPELFI